MRLLVVDYKLIGYEYFMDSMQEYELLDLQEMIPYAYRQSLEQTRLMMWSCLTPYLKNKNTTAKDLLPLVTDENYKYEVLEDDELDNARNKIRQAFNNKNNKESNNEETIC